MMVQSPKINFTEEKDFYHCAEEHDFIGGLFDGVCIDEEIVLEGLRIEECIFKNISFSHVHFKKVEVMDVIFENCDLSNVRFLKPVTRVLFKNCKLIGTHIMDTALKDVEFDSCILRFSTFSDTQTLNVRLKDNDLTESYFMNIRFKNTEFENCNLCSTEFVNTSLYNMDLSDCEIYGIKADMASIRGVVIDAYQSSSLVSMLGVKIK